MPEWVTKYWLEALFGGILLVLSTSTKLLFSRLKKDQLERQKKAEQESAEQKLIKEGVLAILHDRLYQACMHYIDANEITAEDLRNLEYLYNGYHNLGGNGTGTELYNRCRCLPLKVKSREVSRP